MKKTEYSMRVIFSAFLFICLSGYGQLKSYIISVKGDTLNKVDMKGRKQGPWTVHFDELRGERGYEEEGYYVDDLKEGTWKKYSLEGVKIAQENYQWGLLSGKSSYYTYNGGLLREENWRAMDPAVAFDTVDVFDVNDPSKVVDRVRVKNEGHAVKHGAWTYYEPVEGTIEKTEYYWLDKVAVKPGDEDLTLLDASTGKSDSTGKKAITKPQVILDYEKKNAGKKKVRTRDGSTGQ